MSRIIRDSHVDGWTDGAGSLRGRCGGPGWPGVTEVARAHGSRRAGSRSSWPATEGVATTHFASLLATSYPAQPNARSTSRLFHIAIGRPWKGTPIRLYVADLDVRILTFEGTLLRQLTLDTTQVEELHSTL